MEKMHFKGVNGNFSEILEQLMGTPLICLGGVNGKSKISEEMMGNPLKFWSN
jgi:hypothetical protein